MRSSQNLRCGHLLSRYSWDIMIYEDYGPMY